MFYWNKVTHASAWKPPLCVKKGRTIPHMQGTNWTRHDNPLATGPR